MIGNGFVFREIIEFVLLGAQQVLRPALSGVSGLLLQRHVGSADPVLILGLALQMFQHVALHLPRHRTRTSVLADPLLAWDALTQQSQGEEHGGRSLL